MVQRKGAGQNIVDAVKINTTSLLFDDEEDDIKSDNIVPNNINEALVLKSIYIKSMIINILKERPNQSCVLENLPSYILKEWGVISRGQPRDKFCAKVARIIKDMDKQKRIKIYKSKNLRVKLLNNE